MYNYAINTLTILYAVACYGVVFSSVVPVFTSGFRSQINAAVSENVTVTCNATGQPEPNITWYRDGVELTNEDKGVHIVETAGVREFNSSLTLLSVTRTHQGEYWCNATNFLFERFETTSPRWILKVHCRLL